jgi:hypothetical protein
MKINTELCCKRYDFLTKKTQNYRLEHAHCLETINNMWFLGKRESVNTWKKADFDFDGFREKDE